jgi:Ser/Thr protein kinase RdoA (MazF antagonist)
MPRLKGHPLFLTGSDSVGVEGRENKRDSRPFEAQKVFEAVDIIETYARKSDTDPYWSRFGSRESVLLHGDFMLPNILLSQTQAAETGYRKDKSHWYVSGLVDWGDCTIGDRRYDLGACVWSIRFNARLCGVNESGADALAEAFLDRHGQLLHNKYVTPTQFRLITQEDLRPWRAVYELYGFLYY